MNRKLALAGLLLGFGPAVPALAGGDGVHLVPSEFPTIQEAIEFAIDGDEIIVSSDADGGDPATYNEWLDFKGKAVHVYSTGGAFATVIDASDTGHSVVRFVNEEPPGAILEGFTLRGGTGDTSDFGDPVGGGVYTGTGSMPTIMNCRFLGNSADFGGGIFNNGDPLVVGCLFVENTAFLGGGGMNNDNDPTFVNCTFTRNEAMSGGGLYDTGGSAALITNSIFWNNEPNAIRGTHATVNYSLVEDGWSGSGGHNISGPARFMDDQGRLGPSSPAIDAGDSTAVPAALTVDLDGSTRFLRIPRSAGLGRKDERGWVDIGAFERFECVGELTGDGMVDFNDLLAVLNAWGVCDECPEDIDGNGVVGFADLLIVLENWNMQCPGKGARAPAESPVAAAGKSSRKSAKSAKSKRKKDKRRKAKRRRAKRNR